MGSEVAAKSSSVSPEDDHVDEPEKQGPLEKTSSNVRKLVGAFESNLVQVLPDSSTSVLLHACQVVNLFSSSHKIQRYGLFGSSRPLLNYQPLNLKKRKLGKEVT